MKKDVNIEDESEKEDEDYELEDKIMEALKPNTTSKNFKDFLKREDNYTKN